LTAAVGEKVPVAGGDFLEEEAVCGEEFGLEEGAVEVPLEAGRR
jgi:hypothetical protein